MDKLSRDFIGYGKSIPYADWPNAARVAVQFVLNYEEGGENCVLNGDSSSETFLCDIVDARPYNDRHMSVESLFEFGSRVGFWRVLEAFEERELPLTIFASGLALENNQLVAKALCTSGHEIAGHGWRWINYQDVDPDIEKSHIRKTIDIIQGITGKAPSGWYTGRDSPNTRRLIVESGNFLYDSDYYGDELPFWTTLYTHEGKYHNHLIIPYSLDCNDMRFYTSNGFSTSDDFFIYLKDTFDFFYKKGGASPKMMSIGLHGRIIGRPGRFVALLRFIDYILGFDKVWITRRKNIAEHWIKTHPYEEGKFYG